MLSLGRACVQSEHIMVTCIESIVQELFHSVYRPLYNLACSYLRYDLRGKSLYSLVHDEWILLAEPPCDTRPTPHAIKLQTLARSPAETGSFSR